MASIIVADEQEGRRNLLAGTLEREEYSVTRAGTLRQCEGTALATMPDVVLIDGEWKTGDAIDAASRLSSDPEFALKCNRHPFFECKRGILSFSSQGRSL